MNLAKRPPIVKVGVFPAPLQAVIDEEFECLSPDEATGDPTVAAGVRALITRSNHVVPQSLLEQLPALAVVATSGVGFDGIPVRYAQQRGIAVTNTPGVLDAAVCELAIGLLLALLRQLPEADRFVRSGRWEQDAFQLGTGLAGKRVGIVGLGRLGRGIAARLQPFDVDIRYSGRAKPDVPYRHAGSVVQLADEVDILIVSCSGGPATHHLIDAEVLRALGPRGFLVNVSRGTVVDEAALAEALAAGRLRGAALDVFEHEPLVDSRLAAMGNVLLTPHIGSATAETRTAMLRLTLDNLHAVLRGEPALTPVPY
ncbi:MAG: 2-hydroxyacid dehydrogenase [Chloroflexi bacterium]|nr:MAG: 2-hydroxyacid dehydrogenase [Chloroflexota bacterium]